MDQKTKQLIASVLLHAATELSAAKVDDLLVKYPALADDISTLNAEDPTPTKKYLLWGVELIRSGQAELPVVLDLMKRHHAAYARLGVEARDINKLKTVDAVKKALETDKGNRTGRLKKKADDNADYLWENDEFVLLYPKTKDAACYHGVGTKWCIAIKEADFLADYSSQGFHIYFLVHKTLSKDMEKRDSSDNDPYAKVAFLVSDASNSLSKVYDTHDNLILGVAQWLSEKHGEKLPFHELKLLMEKDTAKRGLTAVKKVENNLQNTGSAEKVEDMEAAVRAGLLTTTVAKDFFKMYDDASFSKEATQEALKYLLRYERPDMLKSVKEKAAEVREILFPVLKERLAKVRKSKEHEDAEQHLRSLGNLWMRYYMDAGDKEKAKELVKKYGYGGLVVLDEIIEDDELAGRDLVNAIKEWNIPLLAIVPSEVVLDYSVQEYIVSGVASGLFSDDDIVGAVLRGPALVTALRNIEGETAWEATKRIVAAVENKPSPINRRGIDTGYSEYITYMYLKHASLDELRELYSLSNSGTLSNSGILNKTYLAGAEKEALLAPGMAEALRDMYVNVFGNEHLTLKEKMDFSLRSGMTDQTALHLATSNLPKLSSELADLFEAAKKYITDTGSVPPGSTANERLTYLAKNLYFNNYLGFGTSSLAYALQKAGMDREALEAASWGPHTDYIFDITAMLLDSKLGTELSSALSKYLLRRAKTAGRDRLLFAKIENSAWIHLLAQDRASLEELWPDVFSWLQDSWASVAAWSEHASLHDWLVASEATGVLSMASKLGKIEDDGKGGHVLVARTLQRGPTRHREVIHALLRAAATLENGTK